MSAPSHPTARYNRRSGESTEDWLVRILGESDNEDDHEDDYESGASMYDDESGDEEPLPKKPKLDEAEADVAEPDPIPPPEAEADVAEPDPIPPPLPSELVLRATIDDVILYCDACNKPCKNHHGLLIHRKTCAKLHEFECVQCKKKFKSQAALHGHSKAHRDGSRTPAVVAPRARPHHEVTRLATFLPDPSPEPEREPMPETFVFIDDDIDELMGTTKANTPKPPPHQVTTLIDNYLEPYGAYASEQIDGRGLGLHVENKTAKKYVDYARRILLHVATEHTTDEKALLHALASADMEALIASTLANVKTGSTILQYVTRFTTFMTYATIDAELWQPAAEKAKAHGSGVLKKQENINQARHGMQGHSNLFVQASANASGTMGGNPEAADNALAGPGEVHADFNVRMKARARVHKELLADLHAIETIDLKNDRSIIQRFMHVLSESHLPQRPCTYVSLRFGVPINPFLSGFELNNNAMDNPFWLTWYDVRGCYGLSQMKNKIGSDVFCELAPEITPLVSSFLEKLAANKHARDVWGMPLFPKRDGEAYSGEGFFQWMSAYFSTVPELEGLNVTIMNHRHAVASWLLKNGINPRGDAASKLLAESYAAGMNTSQKMLSGVDQRLSREGLGAYNKQESSLLGLNLLASQHMRHSLFSSFNGQLIMPDLRDSNVVKLRLQNSENSDNATSEKVGNRARVRVSRGPLHLTSGLSCSCSCTLNPNPLEFSSLGLVLALGLGAIPQAACMPMVQ